MSRSISPYINELLSNTQGSVQANGISPSMKTINTISTENKKEKDRERKRIMGRKETRVDRTAAGESMKHNERQ